MWRIYFVRYNKLILHGNSITTPLSPNACDQMKYITVASKSPRIHGNIRKKWRSIVNLGVNPRVNRYVTGDFPLFHPQKTMTCLNPMASVSWPLPRASDVEGIKDVRVNEANGATFLLRFDGTRPFQFTCVLYKKVDESFILRQFEAHISKTERQIAHTDKKVNNPLFVFCLKNRTANAGTEAKPYFVVTSYKHFPLHHFQPPRIQASMRRILHILSS